ncbi:hypothetical protein [Streptomyces sp. NPDC052107]|uniref:hypothetical protein n=1 Tax=Streptomyces sp. NPDC052107 TaxID=3155632 RepID=UPI0034213429
MLPALPAAAIGVPAGMGLYALLQVGLNTVLLPSSAQTVGMVTATLLGLAALTMARPASEPANPSTRHCTASRTEAHQLD